MDQRADKRVLAEPGKSSQRPSGGRARKGTPDAAFDIWLQRGLHAMFDGVAKEPIPEELLRLIEDDRTGKKTT
ncbi:hypothetical protein [Roseomonas sp. KE0001]|uniref:hypothetical protein n=1 Tax=unclassified Roseomonas TaxID=2617492 RepID=UPI0018DF6F38|nr:hypothetical protein [Roseomonas sp. KE0001]MBI0434896.1 hypothetical protein [Roseomonas sp. KE0001]